MASHAAIDVLAHSESEAAVSRFIDAEASERALSPHTLAAYRADLAALVRWLAARDVALAHTRSIDVEELLVERAREARPSSVARLFFSTRRFFNHLLHAGLIRDDPTAEIAPPKTHRSPPRLLTNKEVEALLSAPVLTDPAGKRDRLMLELLYALGLRISELVNLRLGAIDLSQGLIRVPGKGERERLIALDERALQGLKEYIGGAREQILRGRRTDYLFPTRRSEQITRQVFWLRMKLYARTARITRELSPHTLRHAFATHLLSSGAEPRVVQRLLGESDWSTRRIYRQVLSERSNKSA
jgi:integrase/recombinase XerD